MKYRTLHVGLVLAAIGIWLALQGWQEVADDVDGLELVVDGELVDEPYAFTAAYRHGRELAELGNVDELCHAFRQGAESVQPQPRRRRR